MVGFESKGVEEEGWVAVGGGDGAEFNDFVVPSVGV